ncbi:hypothetical protein A5714_12330 [Mycobacterium sp. E2462]|uniref:putative glycolipid-binding domain-containing protein n=1 Tax=unclassified Mycobacterium TaxID=2642494 RepID=UPI0007FC2C10|nr:MULTISPECIES: putative glycolipid-binding domain-containing protein [unclassified Mycobacterium]OBG77114.1 hypothetical protein A5700_20480 [Mycobacterium sp. E1214]OBH25483.1 hypothetical protein A5693_00675 [Mycobacterium sp. E1319]OBI15399.1 hypothetical protein A5714_12330 [Mycobacterium sp. E2462]
MNAAPSDPSRRVWQAMLTWRAQDVSRMESVRIQVSGNRIKANGRIVAAATPGNPAFGAYYDLQTDETGATKRLGMTVTSAERERVISFARDDENMWLVTDHQGERRAAYNGALDVDVEFSPFFNALPIRRLSLQQRADSVALPVVYVNLPEMSVTAAVVNYTSTGTLDGIKLRSPISDTTVSVDEDGFIVDYPGLAERI